MTGSASPAAGQADGRAGWFYRFGQAVGRFVFFCTVRQLQIIRPQAAERDSGYLLACSHISHLDPFLIGVMVRRPIDWMAREEFFRHRLIARLLRAANAFPVRRFGVPVSAIRQSIDRLRRGRIVGICPEGGVTHGAGSCLRGGDIKKGICLISCRTGRPILPCVILGTDKLNRIRPWLPWRRITLWVAFGDHLIEPCLGPDRRAARQAMAAQLRQEYQNLFTELIQTFELSHSIAP